MNYRLSLSSSLCPFFEDNETKNIYLVKNSSDLRHYQDLGILRVLRVETTIIISPETRVRFYY